MILIFILYLFCALTFTISKWALSSAEPIFFMSIRMVVAGIILLIWFLLKEKNINKKLLVQNIIKDKILFLQLILFHVYIIYIFDLCALKNIASAESSFLYNLSPFVSAFFSYFMLKEKMTYKKWIGLAIGSSSFISNFFFSFYWPHLLTLGAVISGSYGWIIFRKLVHEKNYSPIFLNSLAMLLGGLLALVTSYFTETWQPLPIYNIRNFIQSTILIILVANIFFYNLYGYLLKFYTATFLSFAGFMCPIFTALLGTFFLQENISINLALSFVLISLGLTIFYQEELKQGYINY